MDKSGSSLVPRRLIFAFSVFEGCLENRAVRLHMESIRRWCGVFDDAVFVFMGDRRHAIPVMEELLGIGFKGIQFRFREEDDGLYEAAVFRDEIFGTSDNDGRMCFFAHSKGITNYGMYPERQIDIWITSMWYMNMYDADAIRKRFMTQYFSLFHGTFKKQCDEDGSLYMYEGTFYWLLPGKLKKMLGPSGEPPLYSRWWAEYLPQSVPEPYMGSFAGLRFLHDRWSLYLQADLYVEYMFNKAIENDGNDSVYIDYQSYLKDLGLDINLNVKA